MYMLFLRKQRNVNMFTFHTCETMIAKPRSWELGNRMAIDTCMTADCMDDVDVGNGVPQIHVFKCRSCALFENGAVKCWGDNSYGFLGLEDTRNRGRAPGEMGVTCFLSFAFFRKGFPNFPGISD
jgi:hypothetical protein